MARGGGNADEFVFDLNAKRVRVSEERVLGALRRFHEIVGRRSFRMREFNSWEGRPCTANAIVTRYRSWAVALERAGIRWERTGYTAEALMSHLERVWRVMKRPPGVQSLVRHGSITHMPYVGRWGSLRRACELLARHKRGELSREELLRGADGPRHRVLTARVRWQVLERGGRKCAVCGRGAGDGVKLEVDHVRPVAAGGGDGEGNLRVLCWECNRGKGGGEELGRRSTNEKGR